MNPLLFADWGRMNRLFTRAMWAMAVIMVCVICIVLASPNPSAASHPAPAARSALTAGAGTTR
jgi:hypothetical protein